MLGSNKKKINFLSKRKKEKTNQTMACCPNRTQVLLYGGFIMAAILFAIAIYLITKGESPWGVTLLFVGVLFLFIGVWTLMKVLESHKK
jgi:hypothetical protein